MPSDWADELDAAQEDIHALLATRTITLKRRTPGAFVVATGRRATSDSSTTGISAIYDQRQAVDDSNRRVIEHIYHVMRAELPAIPVPGDQVIETAGGDATRPVSQVHTSASGRAVAIVCRTNVQE